MGATQFVITADLGVVESLEEIDCRPYYGLERINREILSKAKVTTVDRAFDFSSEKIKETTVS